MSQSPTADRDLVALPRTAVLLLWSAAYLRGDLGPDDAAELAYGADRSRPAPGGEDLFDWMTSLRRLPLAAPRLVLPQPGRIAGLVGPPPAIAAALQAEQAVVVTAAGIADHTLVPALIPEDDPHGRGARVRWSATPPRSAPPSRPRHPPAPPAPSCSPRCVAPRTPASTWTWCRTSRWSWPGCPPTGRSPACPATWPDGRRICWCWPPAPCC